MLVLAQALTIVHYVIIAIVIAAVVGILLVVIRTAGVPIPTWVIQILWIVAVAVVAILAIKFLMGLI